jgi:hypothetical protein
MGSFTAVVLTATTTVFEATPTSAPSEVERIREFFKVACWGANYTVSYHRSRLITFWSQEVVPVAA